ncbi:MAG: SRPBCC family protein [Candidatus Binatia bacterium]
MYGELDKSRYGLRKARVATRHGVVFSNFDDEAPSLEDYMGDMAWYFDRTFEGAEDYEVLSPPARLILKANWKTIADQNAGDLYHIAGAHRAVIELGFMPNIESQLDVVKIGFPGLGHNVFGINPELAFLAEGVGMTEEQKYGFEGKSFINFCFPTTQAGGQKGNFVQVSAFTPKGPAAFEVNQLTLCKKDLPEEIKATIRRQNMVSVALLQDDADAVQSIQRAATGVMGQSRTMKYNAILGENRPASWPGPGVVYAGFSKDDTNWDFWQRWYGMLTT